MKLTPSYLVVENSINWHPLKVEGATGKAWIKVFGRDPATGATACLVKYAKGFRAPATTAQVYSDTLILSGSMTEGTRKFGKYSYLYRPSDAKIGAIVAKEDTVKFVITGGRGEKCSKKPVFVADCEKAATEASYMGDAWAIKRLRFDEAADCALLFQICFKTGIVDEGWTWVHPHLEEAYFLEHGPEPTLDWLEEVGGYIRYDAPCYLYRQTGSRHGSAHYAPCKLFVKYYSTDFPKDIFDRRHMVKSTPAGYLVE
jgi:hypothetical protein